MLVRFRAAASVKAVLLQPTRQFSASSRCNFEFSTLLEPVNTVLHTVHASTGLSWPVLIPLTTALVRFGLTTPLSILNRLRSQRQAELEPVLSAMVPIFKAQLAQTTVSGKSMLTPEQIKILAAKERRKQRIALYKEQKAQNWKMLALPAVQIPLFIAMSLTIRAMCGWSVIPGIPIEDDFIEQAYLWLPDLVRPDPYGALPLAVGACALANTELASMQLPTKSRAAAGILNISRFGSIIFMAMAFQAPSAIGLYWLSSNAFSLVQNLLLNYFLPIRTEVDYPEVDSALINESEDTTSVQKDQQN